MLTGCRCAVVATLCWLATSTVTAQTTPSGEIQGIVVNGSSTRIAGVTVTITNTATGFTREMFTDDEGSFGAPALPAGPYEVQASAQGYATRRQTGLTLHAGQVLTLHLELTVAPAPETITVAGTPPAVDTTRSQVSSTITATELEHLPVRDRNAVDVAVLAPGAAIDLRSGGVSVAGQPSAFNRLVVDGGDRTALSALSTRVSQEAADSIQVSTNTFTAEYGRTAAGIIHIVTRSGSNELNGSAFEFYGEAAGSGTGHQFGGSVGGPFVRDSHFGYAVYDGIRHSADAGPAAGSALDQDLFLAKSDHQLSDSHRLAFRYNGARLGLERNGPGLVDASAHVFTATATSALSATLFNEAIVHAGRDRETTRVTSDASVSRFQVADALTWLRGAHTVKTGLDVQVDRVGGLFADRLALPNVGEYSAFVQDEWHVDRTITVNAGIRYDAQTFGERDLRTTPIPSDYNNFGPRLAMAWAPGRIFVARAGYGIVYGRTLWTSLALPRPASDQNAHSPRMQQASAGLDWEWMPNTVVSVNYLMLRGDRTDAPAASQYRGITTELTRRFSQGHQYRLSYTRSAVENTFLDRLGLNHRHRFVGSVALSSNRVADRFSGVLEKLAKDWMLSAIYTAQGGGPRAAWISVDARVARDIALGRGTRVTLLWEAFNLFNRPNRIVVDGILYPTAGTLFHDDALFAPSLEQVEPRMMRVAVRFGF